MNKTIQKNLTDLWGKPEKVNVIYFSFENYSESGNFTPPKVTAIAVKNLQTSKSEIFQSEIELEMLNNFFHFVKDHKNYKWVGWNISDKKFGLQALEQRYKFLKGEPCIIAEKNKFNLSEIISAFFKEDYNDREAYTKLKNKMNLNTISSNFLKTEEEEVALFENRDYSNLKQSALLKVNIFASICEQTFDLVKEHQNKPQSKIINWLIKHPMFTFFLLVLPAINYIADFFKWLFSKIR